MTASELDRLRDAYQPLEAPLPEATRARLEALIAGPPPRRSRRRPLVLAAAIALVAVIAVALAPGRTRAPQPASARAACAPRGPAAPCATALSRVALGRRLGGSGDVLYVRSTWVGMSYTVDDRATGVGNHVFLAAAHRPFDVVRPATDEYWVAPDHRGRVAHTDPGAPRLPSAADVSAWRAAGAPELTTLVPGVTGGTRPLAQNLADINEVLLGANGLYDFLPHDGDPLARIPNAPAALTGWLRERAWKERAYRDKGCHPDGTGCKAITRRLMATTVVGDITTLLAYPATPPRLAAALVQVLGQQSGARALGLMRDDAGREVAAVGLPADKTDFGRGVIALDPTTSVLRAVGTQIGGTIRWNRTYAVTAARVGKLGARPPR